MNHVTDAEYHAALAKIMDAGDERGINHPDLKPFHDRYADVTAAFKPRLETSGEEFERVCAEIAEAPAPVVVALWTHYLSCSQAMNEIDKALVFHYALRNRLLAVFVGITPEG